MKKVLLLLSVIWLSVGATFAQSNRCGTMENFERLKALDPGYEDRQNSLEQLVQQRLQDEKTWRTTGVINPIPVVFHVLYNLNNTTQNISLARINAQMAVLNQDYSATNADISSVPSVFQNFISNTGIQFCLAVQDPAGNTTDGIIRKQTSVSSFSQNDAIKFDGQGGDDAWPTTQYLNIWVGQLGGGLLGYAQFPGGASATDGVVLLNGTVGGPGALGTKPKYNRGRTATHEIGHWLNLRHINGDSSCGSDFVVDTPPCGTLSFNCPTFPLISCNNGPDGGMFMNYMDYTDDICMYFFTLGQGARMNTSFTASRPAMASSLGCTAVVGIADVHSSSNGISVYPNPTDGQLTILNTYNASESATVNLVNVVGQVVMTKEFNNLIGSKQLDMSELSNGLYYVQVKTSKTNGTYRVMLNR